MAQNLTLSHSLIQNILNFPKQHENCQVIKLERNYRSSSYILDLGNAVIQKNEKI
jgi:DNA helicase-2/ATP-dependent DNA helicase PcrA